MSAWGKSFGLAFGLAFGAVALQPVEPPIQQAVDQVHQSGGGGSSDGGTGWVKKDHGWVKLIKHAVSGAAAKDIETLQRTAIGLPISRAVGLPHSLSTISSANAAINQAYSSASSYEVTAHAGAKLQIEGTQLSGAARNSNAEWLAYDELVAILEMSGVV